MNINHWLYQLIIYGWPQKSATYMYMCNIFYQMNFCTSKDQKAYHCCTLQAHKNFFFMTSVVCKMAKELEQILLARFLLFVYFFINLSFAMEWHWYEWSILWDDNTYKNTDIICQGKMDGWDIFGYYISKKVIYTSRLLYIIAKFMYLQ